MTVFMVGTFVSILPLIFMHYFLISLCISGSGSYLKTWAQGLLHVVEAMCH